MLLKIGWSFLFFVLRPGGGARNWKRSLVVGTCPGGRWGGHKKGVNSLFEDRPRGWKVVGKGPSIKTQFFCRRSSP